MEFLTSLEQSAFGTWVREAPTIWAYATILFLHTVGLGFVVGMNVAIDLRILGVARHMPLAPMRKLFPWMWWGFAVNALSGVALLVADATTKMTNPVFGVKMAFITLGVINMAWSKRRLFDHPEELERFPASTHAKRVAIVSLILWTGATTAGRLMGYLGPTSGLEISEIRRGGCDETHFRGSSWRRDPGGHFRIRSSWLRRVLHGSHGDDRRQHRIDRVREPTRHL